MGRVTKVGPAVKKFKVGDLAAVGCMVDSDGTCPECKAGLEQFCPHFTLTYNFPDKHLGGVTYGGYSDSIVVKEHFVLRVPANLDLAGAAPLLCAGITTYSPLRHWGVTKGKKVGVVGLGGLGHMGVKFAHALGAHTVVFTTSPSKKDDALRLGADEVVLSKDANEMAKHAGSFDFILDAVAAQHDINAYINMLAPRRQSHAWWARRTSRCPSASSVSSSAAQLLRLVHRRHRGNPGDAGLLLRAQYCCRRRGDPDPEDQRSLRAAGEVGREVSLLDRHGVAEIGITTERSGSGRWVRGFVVVAGRRGSGDPRYSRSGDRRYKRCEAVGSGSFNSTQGRCFMEIKRAGTQPSGKGPADWFTGTVRIDPLLAAPEPARVQGASVTFEPGARTAWHTHPLGQTLIVTAGCGRAQRWGGPVEEIRPGDVVWFAPQRKTLARRRAHDGHDAHRHPGKARRQGGRLDGARERRTIC